jgi:hypothetical protein
MVQPRRGLHRTGRPPCSVPPVRQRIVEYVIGFCPWIAFGVVSSFADWRAGVFAALIVQALLAVSLKRRGQLDVLSIGTLAFFGAMSAIALISPHSSVHRWLTALSAGALGAIAVSSLLVGQPFTLSIARRSTPESLWAHPEFIRINRFISSVWATSFVALAVSSALLIDLVKSDSAPLVIVNVAAVGTAFYITRRTIKRAQARAAAAGLMQP